MRAAPALRLAVAAVAAALLTPVMASAQSPTPEGTVITNTATVSFTDANNNTYAAVQGSVNVTVGFSAGIDLVASAATATPAAPSSGNSLTFTVQNLGNGTDSVSISQTISVGSIVTVTAYVVNSTSYASLAALNTALSSTSIAANAILAITVQYSVAAGTGGQSTVLTLTGASRRTPATTDAAATTVSPVLSSGVAVTPDGSQLLQRVPSNGTNYTVTFTVTNSGTGTDGYNLVSSNTGSAITIVSVNGVAGTTTSIASVAAGASQSINVIYAVGTVANGTADTLRLRATSTTNGAVSDQGFADLTVVRPSLTVTKAAFRDNQTTAIGPSDRVLPGDFIQYRITVTNSGGAPASAVHIDDVLPATLTYHSMSADAAGWTFSGTGNTRAADLTGTLVVGNSRFFWIRAQVK